MVQRKLPRISLGTVYRNLEVLARAGEIRKITTSGSETRFDGDLSDHYHVRCENCGRLGDMPPAVKEMLGGSPDAIDGWEIHGHRLEYLGLCPDCR
jgi:Fur family ferric uptake transcriptional regulator